MKWSGSFKLTNEACLLPLLRRRVSGKGAPRRINGDDEDDDLEATRNIVTTSLKEQSESATHNNRILRKKTDFGQETVISDSDSARLNLAKVFAILRDAYVCTMMSFATRGGMGAVTMGGNINLPSAVPANSVKPTIMSS